MYIEIREEVSVSMREWVVGRSLDSNGMNEGRDCVV